MASITAQMVKDLREKTGAGMMDCKTALGETAGDIEAAVDWLRKKGLAKAAKKAGRVAADGLVGVIVEGNKGVVVEVNSETDFVARNDHFQGLVKLIGQVAIKSGSNVDAILAAKVGEHTVQEDIASAIATIGENMTLRRAGLVEVGSGVVGAYVHSETARDSGLGKIGVVVALESAGTADVLAPFGRLLAMHIAASNPLSVDPSGVDPAVVERERAVLTEKAAASGKPAAVIEKIAESGLKTFFKEVCLLDQPYVHDAGKTVAQAIKEIEAKAGSAVTVNGFVRFALGEGVEKKEDDFAAEVAAAGGVS